MRKKIFVTGIITAVLYFLSMSLFLVTKTEMALTIWEVMTVFSAPIVLFVLLEISSLIASTSIYKKAMLAFASCTCALTGTAHIVNITVTRVLLREGIDVPTYFQIGYWPSVEMAIDYLAWGFFTGLAFLCLAIAIKDQDKGKRGIRVTVLTSGILCLIGFFGAIFINENIWYVAPMGYGIGAMIVCVQMLHWIRGEKNI